MVGARKKHKLFHASMSSATEQLPSCPFGPDVSAATKWKLDTASKMEKKNSEHLFRLDSHLKKASTVNNPLDAAQKQNMATLSGELDSRTHEIPCCLLGKDAPSPCASGCRRRITTRQFRRYQCKPDPSSSTSAVDALPLQSSHPETSAISRCVSSEGVCFSSQKQTASRCTPRRSAYSARDLPSAFTSLSTADHPLSSSFLHRSCLAALVPYPGFLPPFAGHTT